MKTRLNPAIRWPILIVYGLLAAWQTRTPDLLTAGNAGVVVIYAYVWVVLIAALGVALRIRSAWWVAVVTDGLGVLASATSDHPHALEFTRITLVLGSARLLLLAALRVRKPPRDLSDFPQEVS